MQYVLTFSLLILATTLEASGDAIVRVGLTHPSVLTRVLLLMAGGCMLLCYGVTLNLAHLDWGRLIGAYVATFFTIAQIINVIAFRTPPSLPIVVGGLFIIAGGAIITWWQR